MSAKDKLWILMATEPTWKEAGDEMLRLLARKEPVRVLAQSQSEVVLPNGKCRCVLTMTVLSEAE